jgi:type I restriction-modification system DNA methylase subunit
MHWMRQIVESKNLDLGFPDVDTSGADYKSPDLVIYDGRQSQKALCVIEAKLPYHDVFDDENLKKPAWEKANKRKAKYFCTTNFKHLIWYNTERTNAHEPEERQIHEKYHLSELENPNLIEDARYKNSILNGLERFLLDLYQVHTNKKPEPLLPIDVFLIFRLQEKIKTLARHYRVIIRDKVHKEHEFLKALGKWFIEQNWSFADQENDYDKAARQAAYLLVNKILFYHLLQAKRPHDLDPLVIPEDLTKGGMLQRQLQTYFDYVLNKIDYETIYSADFIDQTAFPDNKEVVREIKELVALLRRYDFSKIGFEIIGGIFERLIPAEERHVLGQYFTNADVVDIVLRFCLKHEDDKVFDPACGAGTFLVRAYKHKQLMNQRLRHEQILKTLWGCDIAKFPAHLATINLAVNDLAVDENYPQILREDFFNLRLGGREEFGKEARKKTLVTVGAKKVVIDYPKIVDCIVGNPPYTRQEEISEISEVKTYKKALISKALYDGNKKLADISKRAGIYAYFFVHGTKFLQNGGRFGFVVSNSWLDVDYGKGLQEHFLKYYKIVAIIESKVERWFEDADINTCIVILERCNDKQQRDDNIVRFVYLLKPLRHFIPPAQDLWEKQVSRLNEIDKLIKTILAHNEFYQNDELRIYPKKQSELWDEGLELVEKDGKQITKYVGSKWGKYLRAPDVFFDILNLATDKFVRLSDIGKIETYLNTGGADGFFIVKPASKKNSTIKVFNPSREGANKVFEIEAQYVVPFIKSPRELSKIEVSETDARWLLVRLPEDRSKLGGLIKKYIKWGESKGFHRRSGRRIRDPWWTLPAQAENPGLLLWSRIHDDTHISFYNPNRVANTNFYFIWPGALDPQIVAALLNSTFYALIKEFLGRVNFGGGALKTEGSDISKFPFVKPKLLSKHQIALKRLYSVMSTRSIGTIFEELGLPKPNRDYTNVSAQMFSLNMVSRDRLELDRLFFEEILGLPSDKTVEVYKAVIDLVLSRLAKSRSIGKKKRTKEGIDIDALIKTVLEKVGGETLGKFYRERILTSPPLSPSPKLERGVGGEVRVCQELFDWYLYIGKKHIKCSSELEARYLKVWAEAGVEKIKVPKEDKDLKRIVPELEKLKAKIDKTVSGYLDSIIDSKTRKKIAHFVWMELVK